jgi:hypothetical protein
MASPCDNRLAVNIKSLPILSDINKGDLLIVETPEGTNILDFRNFLITLDNTTFGSTFLAYGTQIKTLSADLTSYTQDISSVVDLHSVSIINLDKQVTTLTEAISTGIGVIPTNANIRISLDSTTATSTTNISSGSTLYIHPYRGSNISLYDTTLKQWVSYNFTEKQSQELIDTTSTIETPLAGNTNYDIFLQYKDDEYIVTFDPWQSSQSGVAGFQNRTYIDNVCVHKLNYSKRLIGCIRLTSAGISEQTFGGRDVGGFACNQLVWNAQNQVPVNCWGFESGTYTAVVPSNGWTGWRKVNPSTKSGLQHRFTFITGEMDSVNLISQVYPNYSVNVTVPVVYTGIAVNTESDAPSLDQGQLVSELRGSDVTPRAQILKAFSPGFHTLQMLENINGPAGATIIMNENHTNQTGYIVSLTM